MARRITLPAPSEADVIQDRLYAIRTLLPATLSPQQFLIMSMIAELTLGCGVKQRALSYAEIANGIWAKDGTPVHAGVGMTRTAVTAIIEHLCEARLLYRDRTYATRRGANSRYRYAIGWKAVDTRITTLISERSETRDAINTAYILNTQGGPRDAVL
ncbi:MAG: hypothetical protein MJH10_21395 [Epibacterium sp.]|nr:hypothetical protein [Epibacterium sp.]NQX76005.1 hypothetical protein [Epibacterium sp.]